MILGGLSEQIGLEANGAGSQRHRAYIYIKESSLFALRNGGNPWSSRDLVYEGRVPVACQLGRVPPSRT